VILRDPTGAHALRVLEQNYRADPVSEQLLLSLNEGKTLDFLVQRGDKMEIWTYLKTDAQTVEFQVQVPPDGEKTVTYKVHYTW
jgi:hypothetical protein